MNVFTPRLNARSTALIVCEGCLLMLAVHAAAYMRLSYEIWVHASPAALLGKAAFVGVVTQLCLYYADLYDLRVVADRRELLMRLVQALGAASVILGLIYFWLPALIIGRGVFALAAVGIVIAVSGWRLFFEWTTGRMGPRERLLLVGTNAAAVKLARELYECRELGVEIVGFIDPDPAKIGTPVINPGVIGALDDIPRITRERRVDRVVVSLADARGQLPMDKLLQLKLSGVAFDHLATVYEKYTGKISVENLRPSWLIFSEGFRVTRVQAAIKRAVDLGIAGAGLACASPLMLFTAALVRLSSPGPILYRQVRVGQHGRPFTIMKFRSMRQDAEAATGAVWAQRNDARVTPVGAFLRKTRLDELPQLWNIFGGDMSFVGPRPERPEFVRDLTVQIPYYGQRHVVKPGLTGWAQVRYPYGSTVEDALEKLQYDLFYIKHMSLGLDLFVMLKTMKTVVRRQGL